VLFPLPLRFLERRFTTYNVVGALLWAVLFVGAGFWFGNMPFVQKNFTLVVLAIVAVSVLPVLWELVSARSEAAAEAAAAERGEQQLGGGGEGGGGGGGSKAAPAA
jgi:membrane-associated protein